MIILFVILGCTSSINGQVQNNGILHITNNSYVYLSTAVGTYNFGATTSSSTSRTAAPHTSTIYGKLIFGASVTSAGAATAHFLDGYARTEGSTAAFTMPIGGGGVYAPARVVPSSTLGVDAAYYRTNPTTALGATMTAPIEAVSPIEYWDINSATADAKITLSWRSTSNIAALMTSAPNTNLTIAGYDGTNWVEIPSAIDAVPFDTTLLGLTSTLTSGSITSNASVTLATYRAFALAAKGNICAPYDASVTENPTTKVWNGGWTPLGTPTINDRVELQQDFAGSLNCYSLDLGANNITLTNGQTVEIVHGVTGTGKIIMSSKASVVQRDPLAAAPNVDITLETRLLKKFDYTYFGTPIASNFFSQLANAREKGQVLTNALGSKYKFISGDFTGSGWQTLTATENGRGFIANVNAINNFTNPSYTKELEIPLTGVANNGDYMVTVAKNNLPLAAVDSNRSYNLLGNPYPSAIDANYFLTENSDVDGAIYIWQAANAPVGSTGTYNQADYITYTRAGVVNPIPGVIPNTFAGKIASGQGFKVLATTDGSVTFTNCMRLTGSSDNNAFYRSANTEEVAVKDRFKLNMFGANGAFNQILIGYFAETTLGYDRMYDAIRNSTNTAQLFSLLGDRQLAINARPSFTNTDIVPLGFAKNNSNVETFTIGIQDKEGVFNSNQVNIYIHDKLLENYHNMADGDYTFTTNASSLLNRFEVVYQTSTLSNQEFSNTVIANINNENLIIKASSEMESVLIFDITGRKIESFKIDNQKDLSKPFYHAEGVYIAKIKFTDGSLATQKLINNN